MKKIRILSLLLVVVFILVSFGSTLVFAEETDDTTASDSAAVDTETGDDAEGEDGAGTEEEEPIEPYIDKEGYTVHPVGAIKLGYVDPLDEANALTYSATDSVAEGRALSVYAVDFSLKIAVENLADFVGLCYIDDNSMMLIEPTSAGTTRTYYDLENNADLSEALLEKLAEEKLYVLAVSAISEQDIARLPEMEVAERLEWKVDNRGLFESEEQRVRAMTKYYETDELVLYADDELAEIAVYNKKLDRYFFSTPYNYRRIAGVTSNAMKNQLASLVEIQYYTNSADLKTVYSFTDAVDKTEYADPNDPEAADNIQFYAEAIDNGVRFNLNIGTQKVDKLLPYAAEATRFEEKVLNPVQAMADAGNEVAARAMRKFNAYYTKYNYDSLSPSMKRSLIANYPGLKDCDLYVLRTVADREKQFLSEYVKLGGLYTWADYYDDLEISGYVPEDAAVICFDLHVDFTLQDGDLVVDMPTDNISYDTQNFTMYKVSLMRYFGCALSENGGFVLIPDGSGSVINFNTDGEKVETSLSRPVYGDDYTLTTNTQYYNLNQTTYMPVYGLHSGDQGYLAILEKGEAMATIQSETGNKQSAFETAFASFVYNTVQTLTYTDGSKENGSFTYFNKNKYTDGYRIRFKMMHGEDIDYVDMAKLYRQYLIDTDQLAEKATVKQNVPLMLETLGLIDKTESFYGIIYNKKIPMTTFEDAQDMINELLGNGVSNVSLRYRGWVNGGLNYSVPNKLSIESKLGGKKGFESLTSYMADNGFTLYPEVDFCVVRRDGMFDGYTSKDNAPKKTDRTTVTLTPRNELDNVLKIQKNYFAISPASTPKYFKSFFSKYAKYNVGSISLGTIGNMLFSDFASGKNATNREQALDILTSNVENYVTGNGISNVLVEGGNAYTYKYATEIVDIPLSDSTTFLSDNSVPFMQIVLHGSIPYSGTALNVADNITDTILKSAEYGANLHFTLSAKNTRELKDTVYSNYYTIDFDTWKGDVIELYEKFNNVFASLQDQAIVDHAEAADGVYITTYANGTRVVVNYNETDVTVEGKTVAAQDFTVL